MRAFRNFFAFWLVAVTLAAASGARAEEDSAAWRHFKGKLIVSDKEFGGSFGSDAALIGAMRRASRTVLKGGAGGWTFHLMAFLNRPAGAETVNVVYYDVTKKREQIYFTEVTVTPTQKTLQLNGNVISKEMGFVAGHRYEVRITRLVGGKEDVYARGTVALK